MIRITSRKLLLILMFGKKSIRGLSLGPFIIFKDKKTANDIRVNTHETIHFFNN